MPADPVNPYAPPERAVSAIPRNLQRRWRVGLAAVFVVAGCQLIDGLLLSTIVFGTLALLSLPGWRPPFLLGTVCHVLGVWGHLSMLVADPVLPRFMGTGLNILMLVFMLQAVPALWKIVRLRKQA
ncbi:MAG: hypothetical protein NXI04_11745 [Planctomycetaceae bacterium]|nr:hypothetical protein [Planctomycetaceae bacterium]